VTVQGFADGSSWARGQAWGLYGYTMMYRETRKARVPGPGPPHRRFLHEPSAPAGRRHPVLGFRRHRDPERPARRLGRRHHQLGAAGTGHFSDAAAAARYRAFAERQLRSLSSSEYLAAPGENGGFLLKHATGHKPAGKEIDVPLNYADYYFLEALLRLRATLVSTQ
jgi:unsaturated chondroitin disaccharide hydrolase